MSVYEAIEDIKEQNADIESRIKRYLAQCDKNTLIELYLQMRFERDLYASMIDDKMKDAEQELLDAQQKIEDGKKVGAIAHLFLDMVHSNP